MLVLDGRDRVNVQLNWGHWVKPIKKCWFEHLLGFTVQQLTGLLCHYSKHVQCSLDENMISPSFTLHREGAGDCRLCSVGIIAIDMESSIIASDVLENYGKSTFYFYFYLCAVLFFWSFSSTVWAVQQQAAKTCAMILLDISTSKSDIALRFTCSFLNSMFCICL